MCYILSSLPYVNIYLLNQHLFPIRYLARHKDFLNEQNEVIFPKEGIDEKNNDFNAMKQLIRQRKRQGNYESPECGSPPEKKKSCQAPKKSSHLDFLK